MAKTTTKVRGKSKKSKAGSISAALAKVPIELRGWFMRTLNVETEGEFGKLQRSMEFFLRQASQKLRAVLWDRATEVAIEEALRHLFLRWGPKFKAPLHMEIRVTDTHLQFSLTVPRDAIALSDKKVRSEAYGEAAQERSLYVVKCLMDRLRKDPAGRQLVFRRLLRPLPPY